jgi:hypothetical protein
LSLRGLPGGLLQGSSVHQGWSSDQSSRVSLLNDASNQAKRCVLAALLNDFLRTRSRRLAHDPLCLLPGRPHASFLAHDNPKGLP